MNETGTHPPAPASPSPPPPPPQPARGGKGRCLGIALVAAAGLILVYYAEQNWRGSRAWAACQSALAAAGQPLDWSAFVPAAVPDDQNVFKAPRMSDWFGTLYSAGQGRNDFAYRL